MPNMRESIREGMDVSSSESDEESDWQLGNIRKCF